MNLIKEVSAFSKAQISAFVGGIIDYGVMIICVSVFDWHYIAGIILGGIIGALVNFSVNRHWSFKGQKVPIKGQVGRFILVVLGSITLKSLGTSFLTEIFRIDYRISRLITDAFVSFGFNYSLQRFWVFKKQI